ncbi:MAG: alpha/beta hydrolase, partial [Myxococcota bacterium]
NESGRPEERELTLAEFRVAIRLLAYQAETQALIPFLLHEASVHENFGPLVAQANSTVESLSSVLAIGMHNAVACSEDAPLYGDAPSGEGTYMGASSLEFLREACAEWPRGPVDEDFRAPLKSTRPVLILSGEMDPITPPEDAERMSAGLAHSTHLVVAGSGHGVARLGCVPRLMSKFVEAGSAEALDTRCAERLGPFPFVLDANGPSP